VSTDGKKGYAELKLRNTTYKFRLNSSNIHKLSQSFDIYIDNLNNKDRVAYWYYAKLKTTGDLESSTTLRYWVEEKSRFLDIDKLDNIRVVRSIPNVDVDINKLKLLKNEDKINITYSITYKNRPMNNVVNVDFAKKSSYTEIERYGTDSYIYPNDIQVGEPFIKTIKVSYPNEGEYFAPEIIIDGEVYPFTKEKISVETRFGKYANLVALILAIVFFLIGDLSMKYRNSSNSPHPEISKGIAKPFISKESILNSFIPIFLIIMLIDSIIYFLFPISIYHLIIGSLVLYIVAIFIKEYPLNE
jgi:hypothetical protein